MVVVVVVIVVCASLSLGSSLPASSLQGPHPVASFGFYVPLDALVDTLAFISMRHGDLSVLLLVVSVGVFLRLITLTTSTRLASVPSPIDRAFTVARLDTSRALSDVLAEVSDADVAAFQSTRDSLLAALRDARSTGRLLGGVPKGGSKKRLHDDDDEYLPTPSPPRHGGRQHDAYCDRTHAASVDCNIKRAPAAAAAGASSAAAPPSKKKPKREEKEREEKNEEDESDQTDAEEPEDDESDESDASTDDEEEEEDDDDELPRQRSRRSSPSGVRRRTAGRHSSSSPIISTASRAGTNSCRCTTPSDRSVPFSR